MGEGLPTEAEGASGKVSSESSPGPSTLGAGGAGPVFSPNSYSLCYKAEEGRLQPCVFPLFQSLTFVYLQYYEPPPCPPREYFN